MASADGTAARGYHWRSPLPGDTYGRRKPPEISPTAGGVDGSPAQAFRKLPHAFEIHLLSARRGETCGSCHVEWKQRRRFHGPSQKLLGPLGPTQVEPDRPSRLGDDDFPLQEQASDQDGVEARDRQASWRYGEDPPHATPLAVHRRWPSQGAGYRGNDSKNLTSLAYFSIGS